jgi:hypothetical protein
MQMKQELRASVIKDKLTRNEIVHRRKITQASLLRPEHASDPVSGTVSGIVAGFPMIVSRKLLKRNWWEIQDLNL